MIYLSAFLVFALAFLVLLMNHPALVLAWAAAVLLTKVLAGGRP